MIGGGLAGIALTLPGPHAFRYSLAFMWLLAFSSATHDIAADGFYMLGLDTKKQAFFVGIRNTAYRLAMLTGQGLIVMFAGWLEKTYSSTLPEEIAVPRAWSVTFYLLAILFVLLFLYHQFILPKPENDIPMKNGNPLNAFFQTFITFFQKKGIIAALAFILLFRFAESQLVKIASPFLLDNPEVGGLGLNTMQVGTIYGVVGLIALTIGGILGGIFMAKNGLKHWIWWMTAAMNLPNIVYVYLAFVHPSNIWLISSAVAIEQLLIRLRVRFHGPHLLHDALQQRSAANRSLRHLHRLHGPRHDAPRHDRSHGDGRHHLPAWGRNGGNHRQL